MSTLAEIEHAIGQLPPEQWTEVRRWMDIHPPKAMRDRDMTEFDQWLAGSIGLAKGNLTTDERMRETRGNGRKWAEMGSGEEKEMDLELCRGIETMLNCKIASIYRKLVWLFISFS